MENIGLLSILCQTKFMDLMRHKHFFCSYSYTVFYKKNLDRASFGLRFKKARKALDNTSCDDYLPGTHNYMLIALTDADRPVKISHAEILTLEGRTLFEVPLKEISEGAGFYLADAFIPPEDFFYIAVSR